MFGTWDGIDLTPAEVLQRNFWFCAIEDIAGLEQRHRIGVDHICSNPTTRTRTARGPTPRRSCGADRRLPRRRRAQLTWRNASELFDHPVPDAVQDDPDAY